MGLLNGFLRGLGFEVGKKPEKVKEEKVDNTAYTSAGAEYDLKTIKEQAIVYTPESEIEVQELVDKLRQGEDLTANLEKLKDRELTRALDFMSGAIYVLDGKIKKVGDKTYFFCQNLTKKNN